MNYTQLQTTSAADEEFARELEIVEDSVIKPIVRRKLHVTLSHADTSKRNQDAMDLVGDIRLILLSELHQSGKSNGHIRSIPSYAATVTFNKCYEHFRSSYPQRASLRNKVRYLLTHDPGFALWRDSDGRWLCGFADWNGRDEHVSSHVDDDDLARIGSDREAQSAALWE